MKKRILGVLVAAAFGASLAACGITDQYATSTSDTHVCVFDGSERGGQRLKFQIAPGADSEEIDDNDQVVRIPASNRFWNVTRDDSVRDPGAPVHYTGNARNGVPVYIEGQIRFRFNLELACEWYSRHGRRNADENGDLGFNIRGDANQGWFRFGNENFVLTMQEVVSEQLSQFDAEALHYNYPENYNPDTGEGSGRPTRQVLAEVLGQAYTERLARNIAGSYFCGPEEPTADNPCPAITFQVFYAGPGNESPLVQERDRVEAARRALERQADENALAAAEQEALLLAEQREQELLRIRVATAELEAQIATAQCRVYAQFGLDCEGHHPNYVLDDNRE
jgi:hypothetical protein